MSVTSTTNAISSIGLAGYSSATQLIRAYESNTQRVKFIFEKLTLLEFDAVIQETHGIETQPTAFPVEDGATIGDHIVIAPLELNLSAIITDTPLNNRGQLLRNAVTSITNSAFGAIGVLAATAAFAAAGSQQGTSSPSISAYNALVTLAAGNATYGLPPSIFDVVTRVRRYKNMCIKSISAPRDNTTGQSMLFTIQLQQMTVVSSQTTSLSLSAIPTVTSVKQRLEQSEDQNDVVESYKKGVNRADIAGGVAQRFPGVAP